MNSNHNQSLESNIPRRGRPRKNIGSPPKSKSCLGPSVCGVRKPKPRAVKLVLPSVQAAVQNLAKATNKSSEIAKTFPIAPAKDSTPITTFLFTPADGKTGTLGPVSKSGSVPMTLVQHVTSSGPTAIKQLPVAVSSNILPRVQVSTSTGSTPKLLLITSNSAVSVPTTSTNQTLCKTLLPVKLGNNTSNSGSVVAGNLSKQVLYKIPSSQSSGMVLLSTTAPSQSGGAPKKYLLIPSSSTTKRQANAAVILNSKISHSVEPNSDKPIVAITSPTQTACISNSNDCSKLPTTIVPISNLPEIPSRKMTRQSAVSSSSPTKPVNTSRRRGSVLGANSTISSIPSGVFKTVACTTNSRGICSTPVSVQTTQKQSNVKLTQIGDLAPHGPLITTPLQQMSAFTQDASLNMTTPTVPQASLKTNHLTSSPHCRISPVNVSKPSETPQSDTKPVAASESLHAKRTRPLPGHRAKKTIPKIDNSSGATSFITVPSSLPFSAIQLKPNCSNPILSASGLSWIVSPSTGHQQKPNPNIENQTSMRSLDNSTKYQNMSQLIVVNGASNGSFPSTQSVSSQTANNDCQASVFSANQNSQCLHNLRPIYTSPPKLTIAPGFSPPEKNCSELGKRKRPSELLIIKEREEFIDDSLEKSNLEDLSPPKLQREDGPDINGPFNFEIPPPVQSFSPACLPLAKLASEIKSSSEPNYLKNPLLLSSMTNECQSFCQDIKPIVRKDNFPTLASLSALNSKCSEFISRLDKNRKLSFGQLFNHFKILADKKKSKKASSHSAIMFQVAHSIHCCVVLVTMNIEDSVNLNDLPFCVEESMKCSVKCRRAIIKEVFAKKGISPLLDPRFSLSILKPSDLTGERSSQCYHSRGPNSSSANEMISFSSTSTSGLFNIKTELPDYDKYSSGHQQKILTDSVHPRKSTTSEASTQKFATDTAESFSSFSSFSTNYDSRSLMQCSQMSSSDYFKESSTSTKQLFYSAVHKECTTSASRKNSCAKSKKRGSFRFCNGKYKKTHSSVYLSQRNSSYKIKNSCNNTNELSSVLKVSSHSSSAQEFQLAGKLRYKIVPKGHISLSGKSNCPEKESNNVDSPEKQTRIPVQSYVINSDKSSINPIQTISPVLAQPLEQQEDETNNLNESQLVRKRKRGRPSHQKNPPKKLPTKKIRMSKMKETLPRKVLSSPKSTKESFSESTTSTKITVPLLERPISLRDPKHLYDKPTTVDRVVMLTPDGKPILTDTDLQLTFDDSVSCLTSPKKRGRPSKGKSPCKTSEPKQPSILKTPSLSFLAKDKVQDTHSKYPSTSNRFSRPPTLNFLLREIEHKSKHKFLTSSSFMKYSTKTTDSTFHKTDWDKSKKANIEQIITNIASGFPAFGPGSPRCTLKLYKYFVSTRIKNRARKNGSHVLNAPLTLYINWKTISRQPFNKHRITNHTLNVMAIKKAKQFSNYKKCKSRGKKSKPVKNRPLFLARHRAFHNISSRQAKTISIKSKKKKQNWSKKTKTKILKTSSSPKKKSWTPTLSAKPEETMVAKAKKIFNSSKLPDIRKKRNSKTLVNNNDDAGNNKALKPAHKKLIVPLVKKRKQLNEKRATKKALQFTCSSPLPVLRTTRSRVAQTEATKADLKKVNYLCEAPSQVETDPANIEIKKSSTRTTKLNKHKIHNEQAHSNESPPLHLIRSFEDENLPSGSKSKIADLITEEKSVVADTKQDIPNSQPNLKENTDCNISENEIVTNPISSDSTNVKTVAILRGNRIPHSQRKCTSANKKQHSKALAQPASASKLLVFEKEDPKIEISTQAQLLSSVSNPADENAKVDTEQELTSPTIIEDSGNFIFEDDAEPLLHVRNIAPSSCSQAKHLNRIRNNSSTDDNQPHLSNTDNNIPFPNIISTIKSSAFSDKFDIGLSPQLARIQQLKDQLQEKQKALDLAKLYLK